MKKTTNKVPAKKGEDRNSLPFNNTQDKPDTEEKKNKTREVSKKALHKKSISEKPLSAEKREQLIEEENGVGDAKRKGKLKHKLNSK